MITGVSLEFTFCTVINGASWSLLCTVITGASLYFCTTITNALMAGAALILYILVPSSLVLYLNDKRENTSVSWEWRERVDFCMYCTLMMGASLAFRSDIFIVSWWTRPDISSSVAPFRSSRLAFSVATYIHKLQASVSDPDPYMFWASWIRIRIL